jgi:hypothetical protein
VNGISHGPCERTKTTVYVLGISSLLLLETREEFCEVFELEVSIERVICVQILQIMSAENTPLGV